MNKLLFANRTALITGAGGGLGRSYALELAKRGCNVVVNDLGGTVSGAAAANSQDNVNNLVKEIRNLGGHAVADFNNVLDAKDIIQTGLDTFGSVDIVINNAGILRDKSFAKMTEKDWENVLNVHLVGTFRMCHSAWPHMLHKGYGRIVNVGSGAGCYGNFGQANYSAAKMGILGLSNTLAKEGKKHNIRVNTIVPVAASRMTENLMTPEMLEAMDPEHITPLVTYLAHEECSYSGQVYEAVGGWYSAIRFQRSNGMTLGATTREGSTVASVEDIHAHMDVINNFDIGEVSYPTAVTDAITAMIDNAENIGVVPLKTVVEDQTPSNDPVQEALSVKNETKDKLKSSILFDAIREGIVQDPNMKEKLFQDLNAKIVFDIMSDGKGCGKEVINSWIFDCKTDSNSNSVVQKITHPPGTLKSPRVANSDAVILCTDKTFVELASGDTSPEFAYMRGLLKVKGHVTAALKVKSLLSLAPAEVMKKIK